MINKEVPTMKKYQQQITVYEFHDGFRVELFETASSADYYLAHECCGNKSFMFGLAAADEDLLLGSIDDHIEAYKEEFMEDA